MHKRELIILISISITSLFLFYYCSKTPTDSDDNGQLEIKVIPDIGSIKTEFKINSLILEGQPVNLDDGYQYKVDWEGDGEYDSEWLNGTDVFNRYDNPGKKVIKVQLKDNSGNIYKGEQSVYVVNVQKLIENETSYNQMNIDLSRSGEDQVVFEWYAPGEPISYHAIWRANFPDGDPELLVMKEGTSLQYPEWSPDCSKIALTYLDKGLAIYDIQSDSLFITGLFTRYWTRWSPDGKWILVYGARNPSNPDSVFLYDVENNSYSVMDYEFKSFPKVCWSPDGKLLAFTYGYTNLNDSTLYIMDFQFHEIIKEFHNIRPDQLGAKIDWSPDGEWITLGFNSKDFSLSIINYETEEIVTVRFEDVSICWFPGWSQDGRIIAFEASEQGSPIKLSIWYFEFPDF